MEPVEAFTTAWRRSFNYSGRATRAEYWWFCLLAYLIQFFLPLLLAFVPAIGAGVTAQLKAVQILELVEGGNRQLDLFKEEEGFSTTTSQETNSNETSEVQTSSDF